MKEHFVIIRINRGMLYDLELEDDSEIVSFHKTKELAEDTLKRISKNPSCKYVICKLIEIE